MRAARRIGLVPRGLLALSLLAGTVACDDDPPADRPGGSTPPAGLIAFEDCSSRVPEAGGLDVDCGTLDVPIDHAEADGDTLALQVIRIRSQDQRDRVGSLFVNPGGPGESGVEYAAYLATAVPGELLERFDLVGFDPRGVGESTPVRCLPHDDLDTAPYPDVTTAGGLETARDDAREVAETCAAVLGDTASFINTEATARDLDLLREAVGDEQLSYLGLSYGAKLGATYAHLFPDRVRAAVLDGPSYPLVDGVATVERQLRGFETTFDEFATDCATRSTCRELGDLRTLVARLVRRADRTPLANHRPGDQRPVTGSTITEGVLSALYDPGRWVPLENGLREALLGDGTEFVDLADASSGRRPDGTYSNAFDASYVIGCNDGLDLVPRERIGATARRWATEFPLFGRRASTGLFGCLFWSPPRHPLAPPTSPTSAPLLVIGTVHDPATPYAGAVELTRVTGSGVLLTYDGDGHTAFLRDGCIDAAVVAYLVDRRVPAPGARCPV